MKHKITAIRMVEHKGVITLSGLTQSPRGTRVILRSVQKKMDRKDRKTRKTDILSAVEELLGSKE